MFAKVDDALPGDTALMPHFPGQRHLSSPSIPGNTLVLPPQPMPGRHSSTDVWASMDGGFPEYMAKSPSTLRWAPDPQPATPFNLPFNRIRGHS